MREHWIKRIAAMQLQPATAVDLVLESAQRDTSGEVHIENPKLRRSWRGRCMMAPNAKAVRAAICAASPDEFVPPF
jgi:3-dehydroquinate dehydratase